MGDDLSASATTNTPGYESYVRLAAGVVQGVSRGRAGFGAFHEFVGISRETIRLVMNSGFFANSEKLGFPAWLVDGEFLHFYLKRTRPDHRYFVDQVLASPTAYDPACMWALFWALARAEHEFLFRYVPFWSNEERLTGHLVSQLVERVEDFAPHWASLNGAPEAEAENHCRLFYADTATARRESKTGADFGLVIHAHLGKRQEYFKVARFQAKKAEANGSAIIDYDQVDALLNRPNVGHFIFYHQYNPTEWSLPPTVLSAKYFKSRRDELQTEKAQSRDKSLGKETAHARDSGYDFATFVTFALADPASDHGAYVLTARDAIRELMAATPPSRVMIVTLGGGARVIDWMELLREFIGQG